MFCARLVKLGLIAKTMAENQVTTHPQFFIQAPLRRDAIGFAPSGMAAAGIGPKKRPQALVMTALLQQHLAILIEQEYGEGSM